SRKRTAPEARQLNRAARTLKRIPHERAGEASAESACEPACPGFWRLGARNRPRISYPPQIHGIGDRGPKTGPSTPSTRTERAPDPLRRLGLGRPLSISARGWTQNCPSTPKRAPRRRLA